MSSNLYGSFYTLTKQGQLLYTALVDIIYF